MTVVNGGGKEGLMDSQTNHGNPEAIFLLGAGISIPIGVPAMQGMVTAFLTKAKSNISKGDKRTCEFFMNELGVPKDLEEFLLTANAIAEYASTRICALVERSISPRGGTGTILEYRSRLEEYRQEASALRDSILSVTARTCFQFDRDKAVLLFKPLVTALSNRGYPVYTTNYDFAFEEVAQRARIPLHDNFLPDGQRSLWNSNIEFGYGDGLTLVKLHGSVTWYSGGNGDIEKICSYTDINSIGQNVHRLVIAPTRFKDIYAQHFFALYSHFLAALGAAKVLVVAGHSLRDDYLRAAIIERCRRGGFSLIVVDPTFPKLLSAELEIAALGRVGPLTSVPHKFEDFADEIAALCENEKPENFAEACARIVRQQKSRSNKLTIKGNIGALVADATKEFSAEVDGYLYRADKPARIRVWLSARYVIPSGQPASKVSDDFLESDTVEIGTELTGVVRSVFALRFKVPRNEEWVRHATKATLHVAVVRQSVKNPSQLSEHSILASDSRELTYRG
jgi:hypothetical protein